MAVKRVWNEVCGMRNRRPASIGMSRSERGSSMRRLSLAWLVLAAISPASPLGSQSLLYRLPNVKGTYVSNGSMVLFNYLYRFYLTTGPYHSVVNYTTFTLAARLGHKDEFCCLLAT